MDESQKLTFVDVVTHEDGESFADWWGGVSRASGAITEACAESGIMTWPDEPNEQARYHAVEHEIARRVFDELRSTIVESFVRIANELLSGERGR